MQIATGGDSVTVDFGLTVTVTVAVPVQPAPLVPVTVYVVVAVGLAVTGLPLEEESPVVGFHV